MMRGRNWKSKSAKGSNKGWQPLVAPGILLLLLCVASVLPTFESPTVGYFPNERRAPDEKKSITSRRHFVSYQSSPWEAGWLEHIDEWGQTAESLCSRLNNDDLQRIHDFMNATCTDYYPPPYDQWCKQDDTVMPMWYNWKNRSTIEWTFSIPTKYMNRAETMPAPPLENQDHILSKFTFRDEMTGEEYIEYIEPLVAALRHPLAKCHTGGARNGLPPIVGRSYIIPPPVRPRVNRILYFDAGASSWSKGDGGPSLSYFTKIWSRHGIEFDAIQAYELNTTTEDFQKTVPEEFKNRTTFRQCAVSSSPDTATKDNPFLPHDIARAANPDDYVLFKLDIDSPLIEAGSIEYLLDNDNVKVDEVAWEHHVTGNPVMHRIWEKGPPMAEMTMRQSYDFFLRMRQKGIRAHSWV